MRRLLPTLALGALAPVAFAQGDASSVLVDVSVTPGAVCTLEAAGAVRCGVDEFRASLRPPADLPPATAIDLGAAHACALVAGGAVRCWGDGGLGQLDVPPGLVARQVSAGGAHSCAIDADDRLVCWGLATNGRLAPPEPDARYLDVSVGAENACAVRADGAAACWGADFGLPSAEVLAALGPVATVELGNLFGACFVTTGGEVRCPGVTPDDLPRQGGYVDVVLSGGITCGLRASGAADCVARDPVVAGDRDDLPEIAASIERAGPWTALSLAGRFEFAIACGVTADARLDCAAGTDRIDLPGLGAAPGFVPALTASVYSDTTAELFWDRPEDFRTDLGIAGFEFLRDGTPFASLGRVYSYLDDTLAPGAPAEYAVRAIDASGRTGPLSNAVRVDTGGRVGSLGGGDATGADGYRPPARPGEPRGLEALVYGPATVELVWERPDAAVFGYEIRRDGELAAFTRGTSALFEGLPAGGALGFEVLAVDAAGTILGVSTVDARARECH